MPLERETEEERAARPCIIIVNSRNDSMSCMRSFTTYSTEDEEVLGAVTEHVKAWDDLGVDGNITNLTVKYAEGVIPKAS